MAALQQVSTNAPSAAVAGILMDKPGGIVAEKSWFSPDVNVSPESAAQTILSGSAARRGTKDAKGIAMPKDTELLPDFTDIVKDAFAGDANGASMAYEIAKDYYAGVMAKKGVVSGEVDADTWKQAINVATGGVHDYNGMGSVLLPWGCQQINLINRLIRHGNPRLSMPALKRHQASTDCRVMATVSIS